MVGVAGGGVFASSAAGGRLSGVVGEDGAGGDVSRRWRDSRRAASETEIGGRSFAGGDTPGSEEGVVEAALGAGVEVGAGVAAGVEEGEGGADVDSDMTFPASRTEVPAPSAPPTHQPMFLKEVGAHAAEQAERELVLRTLEQTNWNRKHAARLLNISYKALRNKLKRWNLQGRSTNVVLNNETQPSPR